MNTPPDPAVAILARLRSAASERQDSDSLRGEGALVAVEIAETILGGKVADPQAPSPSEQLRAVAVALAVTRQRFLSDNHLTDFELNASLPLLSHISAVAEALVVFSDSLASLALESTWTDTPPSADDLPSPLQAGAFGRISADFDMDGLDMDGFDDDPDIGFDSADWDGRPEEW